MKSIEQLKKKDLNCNIFSVYDYDGLTITELLCQFFTKINECIDTSNETIDLAKWLVNEGLAMEVAKKLVMWLEDGTLENIINVNVFNSLNDKINRIENNLLFYMDNYESLVVDDDWSPVLKHLIDLSSDGSTIIFGNKTYNFKKTNTTSKSIHLKGQGANNTICNCSNDTTLIEFIGTKENYITLGSTGVSDMTINGDLISLKPLLLYKYTAIGCCSNLVLNRCGGGGINFISSQDISLLNIYVRYCGNHKRNFASINFLHGEGASTSQNCNEIKFVNSTFEHNKGRLIISDYSYNNSLSFIGCKFEYNNTGDVREEEPILINGGDRIIFDDCRFTHYPSNGCFKLINVTSSTIKGTIYNNVDVDYFVNLENCVNINIEAFGRKTGKTYIDSKSYYIYSNIKNREARNHNLLELAREGQLINFEKLYYRDEGATYSNGAVKGSGLNKKIIMVDISDTPIHTGITILLKMSSTEPRQYNAFIRNSKGDIYSTKVHVDTESNGVARINIPFEYCREEGFSFFITPTNNTSELTVMQIGYELRCTSINTTPTYNGIKGDIVWNIFPTNGTPIGWVCTSSGVYWQPFGSVE